MSSLLDTSLLGLSGSLGHMQETEDTYSHIGAQVPGEGRILSCVKTTALLEGGKKHVAEAVVAPGCFKLFAFLAFSLPSLKGRKAEG